jgi:thioredoxin 1
MQNLQHFDGTTFDAEVLQAKEPVVVDFTAAWCPPCQMMAPVVARLAEEFAGKVKIGKLDTDENPEIAIQYGVSGIPTLGLFREGKLIDRLVGYPGGAGPVRTWIEKGAEVTPTPNN